MSTFTEMAQSTGDGEKNFLRKPKKGVLFSILLYRNYLLSHVGNFKLLAIAYMHAL